jgi:hypothetical protein
LRLIRQLRREHDAVTIAGGARRTPAPAVSALLAVAPAIPRIEECGWTATLPSHWA